MRCPPFATSTVLSYSIAATLALCACAAEASNIRGASDPPIRDLVRRVNKQQSAATIAAGPSTTAKTNDGQPNFTFDELYKLQTRFLDNFLSPANAAQAKSINSSLLAENVQGRVDITRTFAGRELNTEYLFGLFANIASATSVSILGYPTSYTILQFTANANIASATTRFLFSFPAFSLTLPVSISTWNVFNTAGEIEQYDATFLRSEWLIDTVLAGAAATLGANATTAQTQITDLIANSICGTAQRYCNGTNAQYGSAEACGTFLTRQVRFGKAYELGGNTLLCRSVHQTMVPFRPEVHCPHLGPTGGGYCTDDLTYEGVVDQAYFTNAPFVPYGYADGGNQSS